jgi:NADH:ubiquinone oxidoreductase subunit
MTAGGLDDASVVPAEWHGWLHYTVDEVPCKASSSEKASSEGGVDEEKMESIVKRNNWQIEHTPNLTGTSGKYVPYSTTVPKIQEYDGH